MKEAPLFIQHGIMIAGYLIPPFVFYTWFVMALLIVMSLVVTSSLKKIPTGTQNLIEAFVGALKDFTIANMGPHGMDYFALFGTAALFVLVSNLLGVIPGFESPTANLNTTLACALVVVSATHYVGFRKHGVGYIKHFMGPVPALIPLMFPIEVIGHIARPVSLSLRLFGNIKGEDLVVVVLFFLVPIFFPAIMFGLAIFTSFVQTFVFVLLAMLYISGAMEHAH